MLVELVTVVLVVAVVVVMVVDVNVVVEDNVVVSSAGEAPSSCRPQALSQFSFTKSRNESVSLQ